MSFAEHYLKKHRLDKLSSKHEKKLAKLEKKLDEKAQGAADFEECLKKFGPQIADLIERTSNALGDLDFSNWRELFSKFNVIINIGIEVYQLVGLMSEYIITDDMTEEEKEATKLEFGQELIYFVWMTIDPLANYFNWLPFKRSLEKIIVKWLAGYALRAAMNLFDANEAVNVMSANTTIMKALP